MLKFDEKEHKYYNGDKELISVTRLMRKYGLAPNYDGVSSSILEAKANHGTIVHEEIENYIKHHEIGFTVELSEFIKKCEELHLKPIWSELPVFNDVVAGTIDLIFDNKIIADIKTTSTLHFDSVSWQLSLYMYLFDKKHYQEFTGKVFHFKKDATLDVKDIPLKPIEEVERLIDCERNGESFKPTPFFEESKIANLYDAELIIENYKKQLEEIQKQEDEIKTQLIKAMKESGTKKYESDKMIITYIAPTQRESIDTKKLKAEHPVVFERYKKVSDVKESIKITIKKEKENV